MTHFLRSRHDAILIGVGTAVADDPSLNCRLEGVGGYGAVGLEGQPRPVVVDPRGRWRLGEGTRVLRLAREGRGRAPWVVTAREPEAEQARLLEGVGGAFIVLPTESRDGGGASFSWRTVFEALGKRHVRSVMVEGGGSIINGLLSSENSHLVDSVVVTIAPTWLGRGGVVVSPERKGNSSLPVARLNDVEWHQLGEDVVLSGFLNDREK